jgi:septum formation protein
MSGGAPAAATPPALVLASQSPRRAQLLGMLGLTFAIESATVDERYRPGEDPAAHAERLAREKARAIALRRPAELVIGCDTVVIIDGDVLGKPRDDEAAVGMLLRLAGRQHTVATGVAVALGAEIRSAVEVARVWFRPFDRRTAREYVATGEPHDKAGAYGIQGWGAALVTRVDGDFFAVMGLPIARLLQLIEAFGWRYDFRRLVAR